MVHKGGSDQSLEEAVLRNRILCQLLENILKFGVSARNIFLFSADVISMKFLHQHREIKYLVVETGSLVLCVLSIQFCCSSTMELDIRTIHGSNESKGQIKISNGRYLNL